MRLSSEVNQYVSDQAPWALVKTDRERAGTVLYVALRAVDSLKIALHAVPAAHLAGAARAARLRRLARRAARVPRRRRGRTAGRHEVLTGDYASWIGAWEPSELPPGQTLREPRPLFRKLDPTIVDDELGRRVIDTHAHLDPRRGRRRCSARARGGRRPRDRRRDDASPALARRSTLAERARGRLRRASASTRTRPAAPTTRPARRAARAARARARGRGRRDRARLLPRLRAARRPAAPLRRASSRSPPSSASRS